MWYLFYILSKIDRSEVQIDSTEGYLTLWCHQPHPGQSLNPQTVVEFVRLDFSKSFEFGGSKTQLYAGLSGQVFNFPSACKADSESEKIMNLLS